MAHSSPDQPHEGNPAAVEILRVFRNTTVAGIEGLTLLLGECADLRADLVTVHSLHSDSDGDGMFSARQQDRILVLQKAAMAMQTLLDALLREVGDGTMNAGNRQ